MKNLPIGKQHLETFIEDDLIYVDKTRLIHKLITTGRYYFFSRPRRFGKSLLVDTILQIFLGNQELFKGLWIYDKIEWKEHPIIHIDFSSLNFKVRSLEEALLLRLKDIAEDYQLTVDKDNSKDYLGEMIEQLAEKEEVVFLVDEYDKPITDFLTDLTKANENRETLREFFGILKPLGNKLRLIFITGISKFTKVSLFSVLNNLDDLTLEPAYATLVGITDGELRAYFREYLQKISEKTNQSTETILEKMKRMYDGYSWDGESFVYNPFSVLKFLKGGRFSNYWFETGTPTFLINLLKYGRVQIKNLKQKTVAGDSFSAFDINRRFDVYTLMFQTGYITIKETDDSRTPIRYTLGYPNEEVQQAFVMHLLEIYTYQEATTVSTVVLEVEEALQQGDIDAFEEQLNILFADISYQLFPFEKKQKDKIRAHQEFVAWEGYFQTVIYLLLQYVGLQVESEVSKKKGRLDAVLEVDKYVYIMEYKLEDAKAGLQQIKQQKYAHSYRNSSKEVVLMGIAFDRAKKEVKKIEWEVWNKQIN